MKRLFDEKACYTREGFDIGDEVFDALKEIMKKHPEVDARDLQLVVLNEANSATTDMILSRKG